MTEMHQHTGEPPRITVILDGENEGVRKRFHCPVCGYVAFEYFGPLRGLVPGAQVTEKAGSRVVIHCRGKVERFDIGEYGELIEAKDSPMVRCKAQFYV